MLHRLYEFLKRGSDLPDGTNPTNDLTPRVEPLGVMNTSGYPTVGYKRAWGKTVPADTSTGYAPGCEFQKVNGSGNTVIYYNTGTVASCTFKRIDQIVNLGSILAATGQTINTTDADGVRSGGVIVPTVEPIRFTIGPHATQTTYTLLNNRAVGWTVVGITVVPDLAQGGALTATIVKATANAAPASGTTPMHTANAIDCNATANASQVISLTATAADLVLAATDKIGIVFNAALTTGILSGTVWVKRT